MEEKNQEDRAANLRAVVLLLMRVRGIKPLELGDYLGLSRTSIYRYLHGDGVFNGVQIGEMADLFQIDVKIFYTDYEEVVGELLGRFDKVLSGTSQNDRYEITAA